MPADLARLESTLDVAFDTSQDHPLRDTNAFIALHRGEVVAERYADGFDAGSTFISWSMAKSMVSAVCGMLVLAGRLDIDAPVEVEAWTGDDPRAQITMRQLLEMRSGLSWVEDYVDSGVSDVIAMLGEAKMDMASFAAAKQLEAKPGQLFNYSSGTSNIIARCVSEIIGGGEQGMREYLATSLFGPLSMSTAAPKFDASGSWVASSYVYASARDFAAFGEFYRNDGCAPSGERLLPEGWVAESTLAHSLDEESGQGYGLHWWLANDGFGSYAANGYEGQRIQVTPDAELVVVRLGKTNAQYGTELRDFYRAVASCFASPV